MSACVPAPRAHVLKHVRVVPVHTESCGRTHGEEGECHRQFCLPEFAHVGLSLGPRGPAKKPLDLTHFKFVIGREQHVADSSDHSLYLMKLLRSSYLERTAEGVSCEMVRFVSSSSPSSSTTTTTTTHNNHNNPQRQQEQHARTQTTDGTTQHTQRHAHARGTCI